MQTDTAPFSITQSHFSNSLQTSFNRVMIDYPDKIYTKAAPQGHFQSQFRDYKKTFSQFTIPVLVKNICRYIIPCKRFLPLFY